MALAEFSDFFSLQTQCETDRPFITVNIFFLSFQCGCVSNCCEDAVSNPRRSFIVDVMSCLFVENDTFSL